jgi:hypothetical protein
MSDLPPDPLDELFALARGGRPDTGSAEYAFETRLLAHLRERRASPDPASIWAAVSWRLVPFFAAAVVAVTLWQASLEADASDDATLSNLTNPAAVLPADSD